jgi:hypothetical protein
MTLARPGSIVISSLLPSAVICNQQSSSAFSPTVNVPAVVASEEGAVGEPIGFCEGAVGAIGADVEGGIGCTAGGGAADGLTAEGLEELGPAGPGLGGVGFTDVGFAGDVTAAGSDAGALSNFSR